MDSSNFRPEDVRSGMYLANKGPCRAKVSHKSNRTSFAGREERDMKRPENQTARWESETVPNELWFC